MTVDTESGDRIDVSEYETGDIVTLSYYSPNSNVKGTKSVVGEVVDIGWPTPQSEGAITIKTESGEIRTAHTNSRVTNRYRNDHPSTTVGYASKVRLVRGEFDE